MVSAGVWAEAGATAAAIDRIDRMAHATLGPTNGRSAYARLTISGGLTSKEMAVAAVRRWAMAAFDEAAPTEVLQAAYMRAMRRAAEGQSPAVADGPAEAVRAFAYRVGWTWPAWNVLREESGYMLDVTVEAPARQQS